MSNEAVSYTREESVTVICLDDGKANAFSHAVLDALDAAMELVAKGARLALRVYNSPRPVVLGVTGHAMATVVERVQ